MSLLDILTGGKSSDASDAEQQALAQLQAVQTPTASDLTLPELQQYAVAQNMTPAETQAFLQQYNALASENVDQTGTDAQQAALAQLANTANQGAAGDATEQAQESQINNTANEQLAGQRGAIDQQAEARGVAPGLLQAALAQTNAGQDAQQANQSALTAQSNNYQTALNALASQGTLGNSLQSQQNTQANTVAAAQNAMQQFNAANQQSAATTNAGYQQQANEQNTQNANQTAAANTGLANQRTQYNATVPQTVYQDQFQKASGQAAQENNAAQNDTTQGNSLMGLYGAIAGAAGDAASAAAGAPGATTVAKAHGGMIEMPMTKGGPVPGKAKVPGDSSVNDTVHARLSPGEAVIPRSVVQQNPADVMRLLSGRPASTPRPGEPMPQSPQGANMAQAGHDPKDIAALLIAMKHMRGAH